MYLDKCFPRELEYVKENRIPLVIPGGTLEYHGAHCAYGCDTLIVEGLLERLAKKKKLLIAPSIHYSPSSYAVADETSGTVHVEENAFEEYVYYIFRSLLASGFRNIYTVIHHQYEQESLMPMTLAYMKAAKRAIMMYQEKTKGQGWWGSENYQDYYGNLEKEDNPFGWIKIIPTMNCQVQNDTGYDHAGKYESSVLMALYPEAVRLERLNDINHWYTKSAAWASRELGEKMVELSLAYLEKTIC